MILLSFIMGAILLEKIENDQGSSFNVLFNLIGLFLNQGTKDYKLVEYLRPGTIIILLCCLLSTTVLTKCFTSLLLGTFFKTKPSLTVETLEDIVSNPKINVIGRESLKELKVFNPEFYEIIHKRNTDYENLLNVSDLNEGEVFQDINMIKDVDQSKTVVLLNSLNAKSLKIFFHLNNLMESEHKYSQNFIYSYVTKSLPNYKQIYRM